jgi:hypothetical protein
MLTDVAREAILAENLLPAENIGISSVLDADWDGLPRIIVSVGESRPEDETQFGTLTEVTALTIYVLAADRQTALEMCRSAAEAVLVKFSEMEQQRNTPILCVTVKNKSIKNIPDRTEFEAAWDFELLIHCNGNVSLP